MRKFRNTQHVMDMVHGSFMCRTELTVKPHKISVAVYGHHNSYVRYGYRFWGFETKKARNKFVKDFKADPCESHEGGGYNIGGNYANSTKGIP